MQTDTQRPVAAAVIRGVLIERNNIALFSSAADVTQVRDRERTRGMRMIPLTFFTYRNRDPCLLSSLIISSRNKQTLCYLNLSYCRGAESVQAIKQPKNHIPAPEHKCRRPCPHTVLRGVFKNRRAETPEEGVIKTHLKGHKPVVVAVPRRLEREGDGRETKCGMSQKREQR